MRCTSTNWRGRRTCRLTAVATQDKKAAKAFLKMTGGGTPVFEDIREFAKPGLCDVTVIATNTPLHRTHATMMIEAGQRVFLEKPLTGIWRVIARLPRCWSSSIRRR